MVVQSVGLPWRRAALALSLGLAIACKAEGELPEAPPEHAGVTRLDPVPRSDFDEATEQQLELRSVAVSALRSGDEDTAITALIALADSRTESEVRAVGALLLAQVYSRTGDAARALAVLEKLRAWAPSSGELEFLRANTLLDLGRSAEAVDAFATATRVDPDFVRAYPSLVALQESLGQGEAAEESLLAMERTVLRLARELDAAPAVERRLEILQQLRVGFPHAGIARAAARALDDDTEEVVEAALTTLERVATVEVAADLARVAGGGGPFAERAAAILHTVRPPPP